MKSSKFILPVIVFSQFLCTSLWFAGNAVIDSLVRDFDLHPTILGHLTTAVQFGFIVGTLVFAILTIADRFSPSKVFFFSAILAAVFNLGVIAESNTISSLLILRFFTGFFLAGIYPVGMKIASDYYEKGLGKSLGFLVGALAIGTAFPHLLREISEFYIWKNVMIATSSMAIVGGVLMLAFVDNGPHRKASPKPNFTACFSVFRNSRFRSVAFGYFGHMWELYAFWAFVPVMLHNCSIQDSLLSINVPLFSFVVIAMGGVACIIGAYIAERIGAQRVAFIALMLSCTCCLISPIIFLVDSQVLLIGFLMFWGMVVIADSPLLSTLVAQAAPSESKATALTIVNCIGFSITIISIQLITWLVAATDWTGVYMILSIGPILGLVSLSRYDALYLKPNDIQD